MGNVTLSNKFNIPEVVIQRLPLYLRILDQLSQGREEVVNSQELGKYLQITPDQIRKDLSYLGRFGKQGRGYNTQLLLELRHILGLQKTWKACIVELGRLGKAIIKYPGFTSQGFQIAATFD